MLEDELMKHKEALRMAADYHQASEAHHKVSLRNVEHARGWSALLTYTFCRPAKCSVHAFSGGAATWHGWLTWLQITLRT
jgi:hypothetical protein